MGRTSSAVKRRYNLKAYSTLYITIPKAMKDNVAVYAESIGTSVNGLVNTLLRTEMGLTEAEWKSKFETTDE